MSTATTAHSAEGGALQWFRRLVWLGIIANVVVGIVGVAAPAQVLAFLKLDPASPLVWPRCAAFFLILLSCFYIPAAVDPCAHRFSAVFAVACRFAGFAFFAVVGGRYIVFGLYDLLFGAPQAICLYLAWRKRKEAAENRPPSGRWVVWLIVLFTLAAFAYGAIQFFPKPIVTEYKDDTEFFKYGSIGNDGAAGIPYPMWVAFPDVCARHLPPGGEGYASFGFSWEGGANRSLAQPVGFSRAKVGVERMAINCA